MLDGTVDGRSLDPEPGFVPPGNRGSTIDSPPSSLQLRIYCGSSITSDPEPSPVDRAVGPDGVLALGPYAIALVHAGTQ